MIPFHLPGVSLLSAAEKYVELTLPQRLLGWETRDKTGIFSSSTSWHSLVCFISCSIAGGNESSSPLVCASEWSLDSFSFLFTFFTFYSAHQTVESRVMSSSVLPIQGWTECECHHYKAMTRNGSGAGSVGRNALQSDCPLLGQHGWFPLCWWLLSKVIRG